VTLSQQNGNEKKGPRATTQRAKFREETPVTRQEGGIEILFLTVMMALSF